MLLHWGHILPNLLPIIFSLEFQNALNHLFFIIFIHVPLHFSHLLSFHADAVQFSFAYSNLLKTTFHISVISQVFWEVACWLKYLFFQQCYHQFFYLQDSLIYLHRLPNQGLRNQKTLVLKFWSQFIFYSHATESQRNYLEIMVMVSMIFH